MGKKEIKPLSKKDQVYAKNLLKEMDEVIRRVIHACLDAQLSSEFEDIIQDVYEAVCTQLDDFKSCANQEALMVTITTRRVWNFQRDHKQVEALSEDIPATEADFGLDELLPHSTSQADKEILISAYVHQDTMVELSGDLGCSPETLRQRLKRAKGRLKKALKEDT